MRGLWRINQTVLWISLKSLLFRERVWVVTKGDKYVVKGLLKLAQWSFCRPFRGLLWSLWWNFIWKHEKHRVYLMNFFAHVTAISVYNFFYVYLNATTDGKFDLCKIIRQKILSYPFLPNIDSNLSRKLYSFKSL